MLSVEWLGSQSSQLISFLSYETSIALVALLRCSQGEREGMSEVLVPENGSTARVPNGSPAQAPEPVLAHHQVVPAGVVLELHQLQSQGNSL
jgi:hypothetical protein